MWTWWLGIPLLEQVFCLIALPATIIMLIQTIMLFVGSAFDGADSGLDSDVSGLGGGDALELDGADGLDGFDGTDFTELDADIDDASPGDYDATGLRVFSVRGIITFLVVTGWSGVLFMELGLPDALSVILAFALGVLGMVAMAKLVQLLMRLQEGGTLDYRKGMGKTASVYLTIPAEGRGMGKISLLVGETLGEFNAVTTEDSPIPTGESVRVIDVSGGVYTVERAK